MESVRLGPAPLFDILWALSFSAERGGDVLADAEMMLKLEADFGDLPGVDVWAGSGLRE